MILQRLLDSLYAASNVEKDRRLTDLSRGAQFGTSSIPFEQPDTIFPADSTFFFPSFRPSRDWRYLFSRLTELSCSSGGFTTTIRGTLPRPASRWNTTNKLQMCDFLLDMLAPRLCWTFDRPRKRLEKFRERALEGCSKWSPFLHRRERDTTDGRDQSLCWMGIWPNAIVTGLGQRKGEYWSLGLEIQIWAIDYQGLVIDLERAVRVEVHGPQRLQKRKRNNRNT